MPELRNVAQISFARDGHSIECVEDGAAAWGKIAADPTSFDLLITDHHMPKMNGIDLVTQLRTLPFPGKIMVFSSELSREVNNAYRRLQVDRILYKPVFPSTLREVLHELFAPNDSKEETPAEPVAPQPTVMD